MKRTLLLLTLVFGTSITYAQNYYVIIGVFAVENNAVKYTGYARSKYLDAEHLFNSQRNLHYVFVLRTAVKAEAVKRALYLQAESEFKEAWVFTGLLGNDETLPVPQEPAPIAVIEPVETTPDTVAFVETPEPAPDLPVVPVDTLSGTKAPPVAKGKFFVFAITDEQGNPLPGQVHFVDMNQGRDLASYDGNKYNDILRPSASHNPMTLVCGIFGYQEEIKLVDYANPAGTEGVRQDENGAWIIPYQLKRLEKGNTSVMYHISFFKDAVVMTADSKRELDELVSLMNLNPGYVIKIHGHCNGNNSRRIIALGNPKNYFNIQGSDERPGTAKELTMFRAEAVRDYLTENGISADRMKLYGWGGTAMLVGETSTSARLNDRIEIEILND
jgi:outer membrane protein OmpA-like peptidoglycan-associated protein